MIAVVDAEGKDFKTSRVDKETHSILIQESAETNLSNYTAYIKVGSGVTVGIVENGTSANISSVTSSDSSSKLKCRQMFPVLPMEPLKISLKRCCTAKIKAVAIPEDKKKKLANHRVLGYETGNAKVATVSKSGKIKAVAKGSCKIWVYAENGVYKAITITVK